MVRVAVAGIGSLSKYIADEFPKLGIDVVFLSRSSSHKFEGRANISQRTTDYQSVDQLAELLADCDAVVSTITPMASGYAQTQLNLLTAAGKSTNTTRFIPAEFAGDVENYPDQPAYYVDLNGPVRDGLAAQTKLEWTIVNIGLFTEIFYPNTNHYFAPFHSLIDADGNTWVPGTGKEKVTLTAGRDVAAALALLLVAPAGTWSRYTSLSGETSSWLEATEKLAKHLKIPKLNVTKQSLGEMIKTVAAKESDEAVFAAQSSISMVCGSLKLDDECVARDRAAFFPNHHFMTLDEAFAKIAVDPSVQLADLH